MIKALTGVAAVWLSLAGAALAQSCSSYPNVLMNGTTANADQVMADFACAALTGAPLFTGTAVFDADVGIGTSSPTASLTIVSPGNSTAPYLTILPQNQTQSVNISYNHIFEQGSNGNNSLLLDAQGTGSILFQTSGGTGSVGIGVTTTPNATLDVRGNIVLGPTSDGSASNQQTIKSDGSGESMRLTSPTGIFLLSGTTPIKLDLSSATSCESGSQFCFTGSGYVGIGVTTPAATLDVNGAIDIGGVNAIRFPPDYQPNTSIAIGSGALAAQTAGTSPSQNIAVGSLALNNATSSAQANNALGYEAMQYLTSGIDNGAFGVGALKSLTTGSYNNAVGRLALSSISSGLSNEAFGYTALQNSTGSWNVAFGDAALFYSVAAGGDTAVGYRAMRGVSGSGLSTTTALNTGIGYEALYNLQLAAANNTAVGANAGSSVTTGGSNTILGNAVASITLTTGANNILIGVSSLVDTPAATTSNYIDIGQVIIQSATSPTVTSGYGTSPTVNGTGTAAFEVVVGSPGSPSTTGVLAMPAAPHGWICVAQDQTSNITARQSANTTTSITTTWSAAPANGDQIEYMCGAR
jgi:hypothetical protein